MLSFRVILAPHPRRFVSPPPRDLCGRRLPRPCRGVAVYPEAPRRASDCSILFHFPNSQFSTFNVQPSPFAASSKFFICNTYAPPRKCCKQKTYTNSTPFRCNIYTKNRGRGRLMLNRKHDGMLIWGQGCSHRHAHALVQNVPVF